MRKATQPVRLQPSRNSKSKKDTVTGNDTGNKIPSRIRNTNKTEILPSPFSPSLSSNSPCTKYMSPRDKFECIHPKLLFEQSSSPISAKSRNAKDSIDTTIKAKQSDGEVASQLALRELSDKVNEIQNSQSIILDTIKNIAEALTQLKDAFHEDKTNLQKQTLVKLEDIASTSEKNNDQISQLKILQEATKKEATLVEDSNERKQEIAFQWDQMRKSRKRCYWKIGTCLRTKPNRNCTKNGKATVPISCRSNTDLKLSGTSRQISPLEDWMKPDSDTLTTHK